MALNGILANSLSGVSTAGEALRITSNNVANVNTEGFARSEVSQTSLVLGGAGSGVALDNAQRVVDEFLETALLGARTSLERATTTRQFTDQFQSLLGAPDSDSGLTAQLDQFFVSLSELSANPSDAVARINAVEALNGAVAEINRLAEQVQTLRGAVQSQISEEVADINTSLTQINDLNPALVRENALGSDVGALENQLAEALSDLAESVDIRTTRQPDNSVDVSTGSGAILVGPITSELSVGTVGSVQPGTIFPEIQLQRFDAENGDPIGAPQPFEVNVRDGALKGLLDLRDRTLPDFASALGELAARLRDQVNAVSNAFTAVPAPNQLVGQATPFAAGNLANFTGVSTFAVTNGANQVVASTTVDFNALPATATFGDVIAQVNAGLGGAGTLALTDGTLSFTATAPNNGVVVADDPTDPSRRAGRGFSQTFGLNDLILSDSNGIFETGVDGTDSFNDTAAGQVQIRLVDSNNRVITTATIDLATNGPTYNDFLAGLNAPGNLGAFGTFTLTATGQVIFNPAPGFEDVELQVVSDDSNLANSGITISDFLGLDEAARQETALELELNERIVNDVNQLPLAQFDLTAGVGQIALGVGDQRGALALQQLATSDVAFDPAGRLPAQNGSLSEFAASFLASTGTVAAAAENREADARGLELELSQRQSEVSGVNVDEELANLVVFQNAYNASARVLSSVQELFDSLLAAV